MKKLFDTIICGLFAAVLLAISLSACKKKSYYQCICTMPTAISGDTVYTLGEISKDEAYKECQGYTYNGIDTCNMLIFK